MEPRLPSGAHAAATDRTAFEIGRDHARHGCVPPPEHLHPLSPVRAGWDASHAAFGSHTLPAGHHVRAWLQLRLHAWQQGIAFDALHVGPALLRRIDTARCPITCARLVAGSGGEDEPVVERVNAAAGCALGNLAIVSARASRARAGISMDAALAHARRVESGGPVGVRGLDATGWLRAAVLASFATPLPHARAAALPLVVLPPPRLHVLNPVQALQVMLSVQVTRLAHPRRCTALASWLPDTETRHAYHSFMHTLLARRLAAGRCTTDADERAAVERLWYDALVQARWQRLALRLSETDCVCLVQRAVDGGLAGATMRWMPLAAATDGWALHTNGRADTDLGAADEPAIASVVPQPSALAVSPAAFSRPVPAAQAACG